MRKEELNIKIDPPTIELDWKNTFRAIPSKYPPINFFEDLVDPSLMEELFHIESLTNDRLREQVGDISLVSREDRIAGEGSSVVMAAFTHTSQNYESRFSDGTFGIYYAAKTIETALREKAYHSQKFLSYTNEPPGLHTIRIYQSKNIIKPLRDIRSSNFNNLHHSADYSKSQLFGNKIKKLNEWGIVYNSVRDKKGECVALFRPPAITLPVIQTKHFNFEWNGKIIERAHSIGDESFILC